MKKRNGEYVEQPMSLYIGYWRGNATGDAYKIRKDYERRGGNTANFDEDIKRKVISKRGGINIEVV
ncbi:MAG: hypothetical protein QXH08_00245 [Candidatus Hadarchaeales archaeon]